MNQSRSKITGSLFCSALGDALGYAYESPPYSIRDYECITEENSKLSTLRFSNQIQLTLFIIEALINAYSDGVIEFGGLLKEINYGYCCYRNAQEQSMEYCVNHSMIANYSSLKECRKCISNESFSKAIPLALYYAYSPVLTIHEIASLCTQVNHESDYDKISVYFLTSLLLRIIRFPYERFVSLIINAMKDTKRTFLDSHEVTEFGHCISKAVSLANNPSKSDQECIEQIENDMHIDRGVAVCIFANLRYYRRYKDALLSVLTYSKQKTYYAGLTGALAGAICGVESLESKLMQQLELYGLQKSLYGHLATKNEEDISMSTELRKERVNFKIERWKKKWDCNINILFLDFDGVFIVPKKDKKEFLIRIKQLCEQYQLSIVVTSSWRSDMDECEAILKQVGLHHRLIGRTTLEGFDRNEQILAYLCTHPFNRFICLDDMYLELFEKQSVQTEFREGFNEEKLNEARKLLESQ